MAANVLEKKDLTILFLLSFFVVLLLAISSSPLYLNYASDATVFKTMALLMEKGGLLYVDIFDHKGFYIYLFNYIGRQIGGNFGIFLLMVFCIYLTLIIWLKIINELTNTKHKYLYLGMTLWLLAGYYFEGDFTEDVSLPFISYPLLIYARSIKNNVSISVRNYFLIGLCFGILTFIRVNNAFPFVFFIMYNFFFYYKSNRLSYHAKQIIYFMVGFCLAMAPVLLYFYLIAGGKGIENMLFGTFFYNLDYKANSAMPKINLKNTLFYGLILYLLVISITNFKKEKALTVPLSITLLVSPFFIGSRTDIEYLVLYTPLCIIAFCLQAYLRQFSLVINSFIIFILGSLFVYQAVYRGTTNILYRDRYEYAKFEQFIKSIDEKDKRSIYNYANFMGLNLLYENSIIQCNRIILPFQLDLSEDLRQQESGKDLSFYKPKYILVDWNYTQGEIPETDRRIIRNNYISVDSFQMGKKKVDCYVRNDDGF